MYIAKEVDRDLMRARKLHIENRPLVDFFIDRNIIELDKFRILIEDSKKKDEITPKRKLVI
jgi:hypothetical protein